MPVEQREAEWWKQINQSSAQQKRGVVPRKGCSRPDEISPALRGYLLASGRKKESGSRAVGRRLFQRSDGRSQEANRAITWKVPQARERSACPVWEGEWRVVSPLLPHPGSRHSGFIRDSAKRCPARMRFLASLGMITRLTLVVWIAASRDQ